MKGIFKKVAVGLTTGALVAQAMAPLAFGEITVIVKGNGADTDNDANIKVSNDTVVTQTNSANISNDVKAEADTGDNNADMNTGGDVKIKTGDATSIATVKNKVNSNEAVVNCGGCPGDLKVKIGENGYDSKNDVDVDIDNNKYITQTNDAKIKNDVDVEAETGENDADKNTGGDVKIKTGEALSAAIVKNKANANVAWVGGDDEGALKLKIWGNGAYSDNDIDVDLDSNLTLRQVNLAKIKNDVDVEAETGENDADKNTGGDVKIKTGYATALAEVDTQANFNWAWVDDCCDFNGFVKIAGNGYESESDVDLDLDTALFVDQHNDLFCGRHGRRNGLFSLFYGRRHGKDCNDVKAEAETGENDADMNTGGKYDGDVKIKTGDAATEVEVKTTGNSNVFNTGDALPDWPDMDMEGDHGMSMNLFLWLLHMAMA